MRATLDSATPAVAKMDPAGVAMAREALRPSVDPCHRPRACDEAQTCVGGCVWGNRH